MPQAGTRVFERLPAVTIEPRTAKAFVFAAASAGIGLVVRLVIGAIDPAAPPLSVFLFATMVTAIVAGSTAGLVCALLGLVLAATMFSVQVPNAFSLVAIFQYALISALIIWIADEYRRLLRRTEDRHREAERRMRLISAENQTLTMMAADKPLTETLASLTRTIEQYSGSAVLASILLLDADGKQLRHCAAPSLPDSYNRAIDGLLVGPDAGSCGTAAFHGKPVHVSDVETDPRWANFRRLAREHGLRACWSTPIMSRMNTVVGTFAVYYREPRSPERHEIEIVTLLVKIASLAIERERGREQRRLLMHELAHRMKNSLAVVSAIASNTLRQHVEKSKYDDFEQRLTALAQVQSMLTQTNWAGISVHELIRNVATVPFRDGHERFELTGPEVQFPSQLTLPFALAIHELCTNATKYGALSSEEGRIEIVWGYEPASAPEQFFLRWTERNGPPVAEPTRTGFGSRMIKTALAQSVGGDATWRYDAGGIECEIRLPVSALVIDLTDQAEIRSEVSDGSKLYNTEPDTVGS